LRRVLLATRWWSCPKGVTSGTRSVHSGGVRQASRRSFRRLAVWAIEVAIATVSIAVCAYSTRARARFCLRMLAGMTAPPSTASVRWSAVSVGVRPAGKGKVSERQAVGEQLFECHIQVAAGCLGAHSGHGLGRGASFGDEWLGRQVACKRRVNSRAAACPARRQFATLGCWRNPRCF
jgi:hypothetical protein